MTDPTAPPVVETPTEAPPWGENFDAEKAWNLVKNLRADKERLASRPVLTDEHQQKLAEWARLEEASKTEAQRLSEATETARREAAQARADAVRYKAAATYGIPADHFDLLGSGSEEEVTARAEKLRSLIAAQAVTPPATTPPRRPTEQLRGGATPSSTESEEDVIYARLFGAPQ